VPPQVRDDFESRLTDTRALLADTIAGIRDVCADLRPSMLDYAGLPRALREYAEQMSRRTGIVVKVELPGMKSENLEITVEGSRVRIAGNRPDCCRAEKCSFLVMEISYGPFESVLELPTGYDLSQAKAVYVNGFLRIDVPAARQPYSKTTKVPISEGN